MLNIQLPQRAALGICAFLATLAFFTLIYTLWQWRDDWITAHQEIVTAPNLTTDRTAKMIASIPDEHLFGKSLTKTGEVPITDLELTITGIVKVNKEENGVFSKVYISMSGQPSKIYQVGDSLPYGVKIYDITDDTVILENGGKLEKLPMKREPLQFKPQETAESF
jgi:type II secretory pathway component PulC